jgi:hypothetical protein
MAMREALTGALLVLLVGCGAGDDDEHDSKEDAVMNANADCAQQTVRLRREIRLLVDVATEDGLSEASFEALSGAVEDEDSTIDGCPGEVESALRDAIGALADVGRAVEAYYECPGQTCEQNAVRT